MAVKKKSLEDRLMALKLTAGNALKSEEIRKAVMAYGYDEARIKEGLTLYEEADRLYNEQKKKHAQQINATRDFKAARGKANKIYMIYVKVARAALRSNLAAMEKLELKGIRKLPFDLWLSQAKQFYAGALEVPGILEELKVFGITKEKLTEGQKLVEEAEAANMRSEMKRADARKATRERNQALLKAERWRGIFITIARLALGNKSQLLESLGVIVPS
jgi:hypothetical protein